MRCSEKSPMGSIPLKPSRKMHEITHRLHIVTCLDIGKITHDAKCTAKRSSVDIANMAWSWTFFLFSIENMGSLPKNVRVYFYVGLGLGTRATFCTHARFFP
uniref:Uncharacterized protein n=1 Tax=Cacopsylla melanoneura TaxID=428564 RepID=A0A8D8M750_9HEMI